MECTRFTPGVCIFFLKETVSGHEMDIRDLKFDSKMFDVAIDKGNRASI